MMNGVRMSAWPTVSGSPCGLRVPAVFSQAIGSHIQQGRLTCLTGTL